MIDEHPAPHEDRPKRAQERRSLRDVYRRSWEIELLLSGAVLVALVQLPAVVDRVYDRLDPQLAGGLRMTAFMAYYYIKLILYTLVAGFLIHLCARAYWVGMIGLGTAFPRGIRWERGRLGPNTERVYREMLPSLRGLVAGADRFSSAVFAGSLVVVLIFAVSILGAVVSGSAALVVSTLMPAVSRDVVFWTVVAVFTMLGPIAASLDRSYGKRWDPESRRARLVRSIVRGFVRATLAPVHGTATMTLATNLSRTRLWIVGGALGIGLVGVFLIKDVLMRRDALSSGSYMHFPDRAADGVIVDPAYYQTTRRAGPADAAIPYLPDPVVDSRYLRLFVPVSARRANEAVALHCPNAPRFHDASLRFSVTTAAPGDSVRVVIDCLADILALHLDGAPITADFRLHEDPETGMRGLIAFLPVSDLTAGTHTLRINRWPRERDDQPPPPHYIPFWR